MWRSTTLVVAAVMVMGATAASITSLVHDEWELFKLEYNKQYNTDVEEQFRMKIFMDNKHKVLEHNKHFAQNMTSFKLKLNHLGDMLRQEIISSMTGFTEMDTKNGVQDITAIYIPPDDDVLLPSSVDWRKKGAVTGVKNQGQCSSGWAFSTTGSLEGQHFRRWSRLLNISEQNLIDCCHLCQGCQGGRMDYAFTYIMQNNGIDSESYYPYEARNNVCRYNPVMAVAKALGYVSIPTGDEMALKAAVANIGPVSVAIDASLPSLHYYTHGRQH
ncbi:Cathepsin L-like 2 [Homarus americanus]|uniref:Cathepsin L-like 2 n=1 Tax=Homarus americanus TaxID=6706 RepID=A0A8J5JLF4_HOMAM|nr:Cathepsin L-like 2 [Homarus americanus]